MPSEEVAMNAPKLPGRDVIIQKWTENLRSGKFEQGAGVLRSMDNKFCCLGVLCETVRELDPDFLHTALTDDDTSYVYGTQVTGYGVIWDGRTTYLPSQLVARIGMFSGGGSTKDGEVTLTYLNDCEKWTFDEIADFIETKKSELFYDDEETP